MINVYLFLLLALIFLCDESKEGKLIRLVLKWFRKEHFFLKQVLFVNITCNIPNKQRINL